MENVMVSIICNTYNHEKYIRKTIESILCQKTTFQYELLIHDDASTDATSDIIREYMEIYPTIIRPIFQSENKYSQNISITTDYQLCRARGKYIAFCEGDDYWIDSMKLQKQVSFLEMYPKYIGCVSRYLVVDEEGFQQNIRTFGYYENSGDYSINDYVNGELPSQLASLVCRNIFPANYSKLKELYSVRIQGDIKLFLFILSFGDIFRMPEKMSAYRFVVKEGGTSWSSREAKKMSGYNNWKATYELENKYNLIFNRRIKLLYRRNIYAYQTFIDFKHYPTFQNFSHAFRIVIKEKKIILFSILQKIEHIKNVCNNKGNIVT